VEEAGADDVPPAAEVFDQAEQSLFVPLRRPLFRKLWIAGVASNTGTWVQNVGAAWLMTEASASTLMIGLVQAATTLPVFLLAVPAGAIADIVDRRRLLMAAQSWMLIVASSLAVLTFLGFATPWVLLTTTFLMGLGVAFSGPAWQSIVPEVVPRSELPHAVALNSASINLGRAVGPAIGGALVASAGAGAAFVVNAASFVGLLLVLATWNRPVETSILPTERLGGAVRAGLRYVRHSPSFRAVLVRGFVFVVGGSGLWALLPAMTKQVSTRGPVSYGILLGCLGVGAVAGLGVLSLIGRRLSAGTLVAFGTLTFAAATIVTAWIPSFPLWCIVLVPAGAAWLLVLSRLNASAQATAARWVRARALSVHLLTFFGGMAGGSILWGFVADHVGMSWSLTAAAAWMFIGAVVGIWFPLSEESEGHEPSGHWAEPVAAPSVISQNGPVTITVEYRIDPDRKQEFLAALAPLRTARLRGGAIRWELLQDAADETRFVESFVAESWLEHLRHHRRVSHADKLLQDRLHAFHIGDKPPTVSHLIGVDLRSAVRR
jgi:MFS family permease